MSQIISYPHYCPKKFDLRALLLFYDDISTVVPKEVQNFVRRREYLQEIAAVSNSTPVKLIDPAYSLFAWEHDENIFESFMKLAAQSSRKITNGLRTEVRAALAGPYPSENLSLADRLQAAGWVFIASQKIRDQTLDRLKELDVALPMQEIRSPETGQTVARQPVLMPSELGNFAISRLARDIANRNHQVPVTFENSSHFASLYRGGITLPDKRHYLISSLIKATIPDCLAELPTGDYWVLREQYTGVRKNLNKLIAETMQTRDLDGSDDFKEFVSRTEMVVEDLRAEIEKVAQNVQPKWVENTCSVVLDTSFALTGAFVGFAFGEFPGALAGIGLGKLTPKVSKFFTTRSDDLVSQIGHVRARITQHAQTPAYRVPSYMI